MGGNLIFKNIYLPESSTDGIHQSGPKAFEIPQRYLKVSLYKAEKAMDLKELLADQRVVLAAMSTDQRIAPAAMFALFAGLVVTTGRSPRLAVVSKAETKGRVSKAEQKQSCRLSRQQSSPRF